eukprot:4011561-Amphidinium_carterae.4
MINFPAVSARGDTESRTHDTGLRSAYLTHWCPPHARLDVQWVQASLFHLDLVAAFELQVEYPFAGWLAGRFG